MDFNALFLIDIETVPQQQTYALLAETEQELWQEKAAKINFPEPLSSGETYLERAGILAEFGKIVCISAAYYFCDAGNTIKLKQKTIADHDEANLLKEFLLLCDQFIKVKKKICFAGHNIKEFDIPFICRRLVIHRMALPQYLYLHGQKPWENNALDTLHWWRFGDYKNYISLKLLAAVLGIAGSKDDIDGSMVRKVYYEENGLHRIAVYCAKDVQVVAQILLRFANLPLLTENDFIAQSNTQATVPN